jgi:hypothetical protein
MNILILGIFTLLAILLLHLILYYFVFKYKKYKTGTGKAGLIEINLKDDIRTKIEHDFECKYYRITKITDFKGDSYTSNQGSDHKLLVKFEYW